MIYIKIYIVIYLMLILRAKQKTLHRLKSLTGPAI